MSAKGDCGNHKRHHFFRRLFFCLLAFVFLVLLVVLIVWLVLRPTKPRFSLQGASVYQFNLSSSPSLLTSTLQVTISSRNPNDRIGVYYDRLDVYAVYKSQQITTPVGIPRSYQGHNEVSMWSPFLSGVGVPVAPYLAGSLGQDEQGGVVLLYVKIDGRVRWKVGSWTSGRYHLNVNCPAFLTFDGRGGADGGSGYSPVIKFQQITSCSVDV